MPEYNSYRAMKGRCLNKNNDRYKNYGDRGITVCDRWLNSFENFFEDMGPRPDGTTLDRENVNGNYEPSNCRWATRYEQINNKSDNVKICLYGVTLNIAQWASVLEIPRNRIYGRLANRKESGLSIHDVIFNKLVTNGTWHKNRTGEPIDQGRFFEIVEIISVKETARILGIGSTAIYDWRIKNRVPPLQWLKVNALMSKFEKDMEGS